MSRQNRTQLALGILLVLVGVWFIAVRQVPILKPFADLNFDWPFYVIGAGVILLLIGLVTDAPRMAIPAAIVAGIGGILYYQNMSCDWEILEFHVDADSRFRGRWKYFGWSIWRRHA